MLDEPRGSSDSVRFLRSPVPDELRVAGMDFQIVI